MEEEEILSMEEEKEKGNEKYKKQEYKESIKHYSNAIEIKETAILYSNRSASYYQLGELDKSLNDAIKSIEIEEKYAKGYYRAGQCFYRIKEYERAKEYYGKKKK
jgi:tetratricopeptide (TPR) repeat protein